MAEHAGKPEVRFAGFTEAWEQRKLGDLLVESKIKGHPGNVAKKLTVKLWGKGVVEKNDFGGSIYTQYYIRKYEQFIYSKLDFLNSAFAVIPKNMDGYESTADLPAFDCVNSNPYFIFYRVTQKDFYLKNGAVADGSRKAKRIHVDTFLGMEITAPNFLEQDKIVHFFQVLDRLITLHQCNCNMATRPCEWSSGLRAIAWEQRKLGDLAEFNPKAELPTNFEYVDLESVVGTELINHRTQTKCTAPSRAQRLAQYGDLFYQLVRPYQKNNYLFELNSENFVFSTGYAQLRPSVDGYFLMSLVQNEYFVQKVLDNCTGTSYPAINVNDLAEINIYTSLKKSEQARIGTFFRQLDRLVTLHQRKHILLT